MALPETWIHLDDPPAIANAAPDGFKIVKVARCRASARSSTLLDSKQNVGEGLAVIYCDDLTLADCWEAGADEPW